MKRTIFLLAFAAGMFPVELLAQKLSVLPNPRGVWVAARDLYRPGSEIRIERTGSGEPQEVAVLRTPASEAAFISNYRAVVLQAGAGQAIPAQTLAAMWQRFSRYRTLDSMGMYAANLPVLAAMGAAVFDADGRAGTGSYTASSNSSDRRPLTARVGPLPDPAGIGRLAPALIQPTRDGVTMEFVVEEAGTMQTCLVRRSYYLRSTPETIAPQVLFSNRTDGKTYAMFTDYTAVPKVAYTYTLTPVDAAGNEGLPSVSAKVINAPEHSVPPSVRHFSATSATAEKAVRLSWLPPATPDVVSVDIYKSPTYSGGYRKLASLRPEDTVYLDYDVKPITTYYYTAVINGSLERSVQSPRVPGTLHATGKSRLPPRNLRAEPDGNVVTLRWERAEDDARGYFLYRAEGYTGKLVKMGNIILSTEGSVSATDTLPPATTQAVYSYAIAAENTSYSESPLSERAAVQIVPDGPGALPVVADVRVVRAESGALRVMWTAVQDRSAAVEGYHVYRTVAEESQAATSAPVKLTAEPLRAGTNLYYDAAVSEGNSYAYQVKAVGAGGIEGGGSQPSGYTIPAELPLQVSGIQAAAIGKEVRLAWSTPLGEPLKKIRILRAATNKEPKEIAAVEPATGFYVDKGVKEGETYHYFFITENARARRSLPTVPVSVALD